MYCDSNNSNSNSNGNSNSNSNSNASNMIIVPGPSAASGRWQCGAERRLGGLQQQN